MAEEKNLFERPSLDEFAAPSYDEWKAEAIASLKGADFDKKLLTKTYEGITLKPIYTKADFAGNEEVPGQGDYLRGTDDGGYIANPWAIAQEVKACCPKKANEKLLHEIERGATAINLNLGHDIKVESAEDMKTLFANVDLCKAKLHVRTGASALELLKLAVENVKGFENAQGCFGADPLGKLACKGALNKAPAALYDDMAETVKLASKAAPKLRTVLCDGNIYVNGGASAVQEAAYVLATASEYMNALIERGISPDDAARSIRVSFALSSNFFMEIAKLRAVRVMFAKIARAYGCGDEAAKADVFARTAQFNKTVFDPYVNILRDTTEAFSGVVGGVNAMQIAPLDEPIGESDETTERIARNIQIMLQQEFNLMQPVDPAGGSWYVETLTEQLVSAISAKFKEIEAAGGILEALKRGDVQKEVAAVMTERFKKLATRADRAVGTNMYANMSEKPLEREAKKKCCNGGCKCENPAITVAPIEKHRLTEQFEAVRKATDADANKTGKRMSVFLANMGPIPQHKARADFSTGFFEVGGLQVISNNGFMTVDEAAKAALASGACAAVICSTDDTYPQIVPELARLIKAGNPEMSVILAGAPDPEQKPNYDAAGVDEYVHVRANCLEILRKLQKERGIG